MADVQCGTFELVERDAMTGNLRWRAPLTPAPDAEWRAAFDELQAVERAIGNTAVGRIDGGVIQFVVPEVASEATAGVIRRCVAKTNPEAATRQAARRAQGEAQKRQADEEWRRVREKFGRGI